MINYDKLSATDDESKLQINTKCPVNCEKKEKSLDIFPEDYPANWIKLPKWMKTKK